MLWACLFFPILELLIWLGLRKLSIPIVSHNSSSVRTSPDFRILETSAALRRIILLWWSLSSFEYHAEARSCSDLEGIKAHSLLAENETDLTMARFFISCVASTGAEGTESSEMLAPLCLGAWGKSTIKLLPSWQWCRKSRAAIVVVCVLEWLLLLLVYLFLLWVTNERQRVLHRNATARRHDEQREEVTKRHAILRDSKLSSMESAVQFWTIRDSEGPRKTILRLMMRWEQLGEKQSLRLTPSV